jgi:hypothetical protein
MLAQYARFAPAHGKQHGMRGNRGVTDEGSLFARIEKAQPHIVVGRIGRHHEGNLRMRKFARHGLQRGIALRIGVQNHDGRIAGETRGRKGIDFSAPSRRGVLHASVPQATLPSQMRAAIEISMYPLSGDYLPRIQAFIDRLNTYQELRVQTNSLSTQVWGPLDRALAILAQEMGRSASEGPQLVYVMKVLPGLAPPASP